MKLYLRRIRIHRNNFNDVDVLMNKVSVENLDRTLKLRGIITTNERYHRVNDFIALISFGMAKIKIINIK